MANYTLDFTGAEVNELLGQVAASGAGGGGVMRVNVTYEGMDEGMGLINPRADKTHAEIKAHIESGRFAFATIEAGGLYSMPLYSAISSEMDEAETITFMTYTEIMRMTVTVDKEETVTFNMLMFE